MKGTDILVFTDHFNKWVEVFAIKRIMQEVIAKHFVEDVICRHGTLEKFLTDRRTQFLSEVILEINKKLAIQKINTSPYRPQTNGLTERFNKTLVQMLTMYVGVHQKDWDEFLPYVCFAYRTAIHSSTGETPFYVMHGRDPRIPGDLSIREEEERRTVNEYKQELTSNLAKIQDEIRYYGEIIRQNRERKINRERKEHSFIEGQLVWLYTRHRKKGLSVKLMFPWHGPYRIVALTSPVNARIQSLTGRMVNQIVHVSRLKKFNTPTRPIDEVELEEDDNFDIDQEMVENNEMQTQKEGRTEEIIREAKKIETSEEIEMSDEDIDSNGEYEVEEIIAGRVKAGKEEYLVK